MLQRARASAASRRHPPRAGSEQAPGTDLNVVLRQLPFAVLLGLILAWYLVFDPELSGNSLAFAGAVTAFAATVLAMTVPWHRLSSRWSAVIPVLDIVAVGLLETAGVATRYTLVLPVLWMSTTRGFGQVAVAVLLSTLAAWSPLLGEDVLFTAGDLEARSLSLLPLLFLAIGIYGHLTHRLSRARESLRARQGALLEEVLADSRAEHDIVQTILNTIDVGVMVISRNGRVTMANRAHNTMAHGRLTVGDHVIRDLPGVLYEEDRRTRIDRHQTPLARASRGEDFQHFLVWWDLDGHWRAFRLSSGQFRPGGRAAGAVVAYQDLTSEIDALSQLEDFVSSVSHELRTPLTAIVGYLELALDDDGVTPETRSALDVVQRNAERLLRLIGDLLTAAQTRRTELGVRRERTDLRDVVADAVQNVLPRAAEAHVTVRNRVTEPCPVSIDRTRMLQVVDNLLSNAVKYSRHGGTVELTLERGPEGLHLHVADDGIGISEQDQQHLFTRFFRARPVRGGPVQGTGLGLHITRQIINAHGGRIEVSSRLGQGTQVTVHLPPALLEDV